MAQGAPKDYSLRSRRSVQLVAGLGSSVAPFLVASMVVAAPTIGVDLRAEVALLAWLTAAFFLAAASLLIPFGRVADVRGSKKVFTAGLSVYVISGAVCALAPSIEVLIIGRALTGVGAAMVFGTSIALLSLVFPQEDRGKAIGLNVTFMFAGFTAGLLAGGFVTFYLSWRYLFLIAMVVAVADLALLLSRVKGECELARQKDYDPPGMALYSISLLLLFYGLSEITASGGQLSLLAGAASAAGLVAWERRYRHPIINKAVSRNRPFIMAIGTNVLFQSGAFAVPFLLSLHFQYVLDLDARLAGIVLLLPQVLMTTLGWASGRLTGRIGNRAVAGLGGLINIGGLAALLTIDVGTPITVPLVALALVGVGTGLFMPAVVNWALSRIDRQDYGVASAVTETSRLLGMTVSNVIIILVFSAVLGATTIVQADEAGFLEALRACSAAFLALSAISVLLSLLKRPGAPAQRR